MTTTLVKRPARTQPPPNEAAELSIADPPPRAQMAPAAAGAGMMMMPIMSGTGSLAVAVTQNRPILVVSGFLVLIGSIALGAIMIISQRSGTKRQLREGRERYLDYVEELRHTVRDQIAAQRAEQAWRFPRSDQLIDICRDDARRWERRVNHSDFLRLRLGTGEVPLASGLMMAADTGPLNNFDPVCLQAAQELRARYATLRDQPITTALLGVGNLSLLGRLSTTRVVATSFAVQLASLQGPNDLEIAVIRSDSAADHWDWVKWLPHNQDTLALDGDVPVRRVASNAAAMQALLQTDIEERLDRHQRARGNQAAAVQHLVVFVDNDGAPTPQHLSVGDGKVRLADLGIHVITLVTDQRDEPEVVDDRLQVFDDGSAVLASDPSPFTIDPLAAGTETVVARQLSALRLTAEHDADSGLTDTVALPDILGVDDAAHLDLGASWRPRALRDLLRVPIGVGGNGGAVMLDLKESAHGGMGPHGLVVGATGSGKSEMLRTLVSSLVIGHSPDRLALMLVDFKGGATFAAMGDIPHIAGMITNLQDDLTLVDRMRDALYGEMQRRQEVLKRAGNLPNVTEYHDRIDAGEDLEPLPHLLVIVDEFSELLTAKPDFAELFVAIGRIGRSIGVHLLLATQKLEMGKIRGLESHLSYRISLRTFSETESRDAIGVPDAYHLPPEPGSGFLKVDTSVFERFKAALVSARYTPPNEGPKTTVPVVPYIAVNGVGAWLAHQAAQLEQAARAVGESDAKAGDPTVMDVLFDQIADSGAARVRPVWLEPLPKALPLDRVQDVDQVVDPVSAKAVLGMVDEPAKQSQYAMEWDFAGSGSNLLVVGAPQSGKSTVLRTLIGSMGLRYQPGAVVFYCIDYGGGSLQALSPVPHVAGVTTRSDPERLARTIYEVRGVLDSREAIFREHGLENMAAFRRARADGRIPSSVPGDVFLIVDGWGNFREDHEELDYVVDEIASRGASYGIHVILTVTQSMQVRMRMQPSFGGRIELRLNDVYDSDFGRKIAEQIPRDVPGRGAIEGERIFQAAMPRVDGADDLESESDEHESEAQAALVTMIVQRWPDNAVQRVQTLPPIVRLEQLPPVDPAYGDVPVGVLDRSLDAVSVDLAGSSPHLLVLGDPETGKTNFLKTIIKGYTSLMPPERLGIILVDFRRTLLDVVPPDYLVSYCTNRDQTEAMATELAFAMKQRLPGPDVTSDQLRNRSWWTGLELLVIAEDFDLVATSSGNPMGALVDYVPQGGDLGLHLVLSRRMNGMSRAQFEPMMQRLIDISTSGYLFSGDRLEGRLLNGVAPARLPVGRALYVDRNGLVGQVQTALGPDEE